MRVLSSMAALAHERDYRINRLQKVLHRLESAAALAADDLSLDTDNPAGRCADVLLKARALVEAAELAQAAVTAVQRNADFRAAPPTSRRA